MSQSICNSEQVMQAVGFAVLGVDTESLRQTALDQFVNLCDMIAPGCVKVEIRSEQV